MNYWGRSLTITAYHLALVCVQHCIVRRKHCFEPVCRKTRHCTKMTSRLEKERSKQIQEKCQNLLIEMLRDEDNKYCVDCDAKGSCVNCIFFSNVSFLFDRRTPIILSVLCEYCKIAFLYITVHPCHRY